MTLARLLGLAPKNDNDTMMRFAETGESQWLNQLVSKHSQALFSFLCSQADPQLAEELVQQTWLRVLEKRHQYSPQAQFRTWLFTIGHNLMLDEFRRHQRWQMESEDHIPESLSEDLLEQMSQQSMQQRFDHLLEQLPFPQREAFVLQQEGFALADISQITGQPQETIKSRLRAARQFFKKHLRPEPVPSQSSTLANEGGRS